MTKEIAIAELRNMWALNYTLAPDEVFEMAISALEAKPETRIIHCKDCINRGIVNTCPFAQYSIVKNANSGNHSTTTVEGEYFDASTRVIIVCPVTDDDYCSRGEAKENA